VRARPFASSGRNCCVRLGTRRAMTNLRRLPERCAANHRGSAGELQPPQAGDCWFVAWKLAPVTPRQSRRSARAARKDRRSLLGPEPARVGLPPAISPPAHLVSLPGAAMPQPISREPREEDGPAVDIPERKAVSPSTYRFHLSQAHRDGPERFGWPQPRRRTIIIRGDRLDHFHPRMMDRLELGVNQCCWTTAICLPADERDEIREKPATSSSAGV